jgi:pimeloyl-ACP methyl ester carboxylesterase
MLPGEVVIMMFGMGDGQCSIYLFNYIYRMNARLNLGSLCPGVVTGPEQFRFWNTSVSRGRRSRHTCQASTIPISEFKTFNGISSDPYLCSPLPEAYASVEDRESLPILLYLPGIDGTGLAAFKQFPVLMEHFNLITFVTPPENRTSYDELVEIVSDMVRTSLAHIPATQPVYIMGESFGGLLALSLAESCPGIVDRIILVNPATSFKKTVWPIIGPVLLSTPKEAYGALPILLAPVLGNPINLLQASLDGLPSNSSLVDQALGLVQGAFALLEQLPVLADILPRDTLEHKLKLLEQGCNRVNPEMVKQRVFILAGEQDLLLPSESEAEYLQGALPRAHTRVERGRSHALLQEGGVNLVSILKEEGFYTFERKLSVATDKRAKGSTFGTPQPIELPTDIELQRYGSKVTSLSRSLTSPVFISKDQFGEGVFGLDGLPLPGDRPIVFVGNHQSLALDMGIFCEQVLKERGIMLRGLAHPAIFSSRRKNRKDTEDNSTRIDAMPAFINALNGRDNRSSGTRNRSFEYFLEEFGAVPVGPSNFVKLLANKEAVLLYPGGVKEAYRKKGQEYQLFWPEKSEFVRMAAKYNAIIVPFAGVGVDDALNVLVDSDEMRDIPLLGSFISQSAESVPQARRGVNANGNDAKESFVSPIAVPKLPPNRLYYMFQQPIPLTKDIVGDREQCDEIYAQIKDSVESGISYLLEKRDTDPYKDFPSRLYYERVIHNGKQAPTFDLP